MKGFDYLVRENFSQYAGEWVAILEERVVAHGASFKQVAEELDRKFPKKRPLLTRIPENALVLRARPEKTGLNS